MDAPLRITCFRRVRKSPAVIRIEEPALAVSLKSGSERCGPPTLGAPLADAQRDGRETVEAKNPRRRRAEVYQPSMHEGPAIIDPHRHGTTVAVVDHSYDAAERQRAVSGGHGVGVHGLSARSSAATVHRSDTQSLVALPTTGPPRR